MNAPTTMTGDMPKRRRIRRNPAPFQVIAAELTRQIEGGRYVAGEALPPRRALAESFAVTINTMGKAIDELMKQGMITATERHGTFVSRDFTPQKNVAARAVPAESSNLVHIAGLVAMIAPMNSDLTVLRQGGDRHGEDRWALTILRGLEAGLSEAGVQSRLYRVWDHGEAYPDLATATAAAAADGVGRLAIVNIHNYEWIVADMLRLIDPRKQPVICVAGIGLDAAFPQVCYDQRQAGYLAARHLAEAGYEHMVFAKLAEAEWIDQRCDGARRAIAQFGRRGSDFTAVATPGTLGVDTSIQHLTFADHQALLTTWFGHAVASGALRTDGSCAVILPADTNAIALLAVLRERGIQPGRDLGVISFDDYTGSIELGLSTVRPPLEQLGAYAARHMLSGSQIAQHCLPSLVVARASTCRG